MAQVPLQVFTDGACKGNPGPMGAGIVVVDPTNQIQTISISQFLGKGTNNIAELTALKIGLEIACVYDRPIQVFTDSKYTINVLTRFKANKNVALINSIKSIMSTHPHAITLNYVKGHHINPYNNQADRLASTAANGG